MPRHVKQAASLRCENTLTFPLKGQDLTTKYHHAAIVMLSVQLQSTNLE